MILPIYFHKYLHNISWCDGSSLKRIELQLFYLEFFPYKLIAQIFSTRSDARMQLDEHSEIETFSNGKCCTICICLQRYFCHFFPFLRSDQGRMGRSVKKAFSFARILSRWELKWNLLLNVLWKNRCADFLLRLPLASAWKMEINLVGKLVLHSSQTFTMRDDKRRQGIETSCLHLKRQLSEWGRIFGMEWGKRNFCTFST